MLSLLLSRPPGSKSQLISITIKVKDITVQGKGMRNWKKYDILNETIKGLTPDVLSAL